MVKIAVVMFYTEDYSIGKHANQFNKIYCDKNNYDLFVYHDIPEHEKCTRSSYTTINKRTNCDPRVF